MICRMRFASITVSDLDVAKEFYTKTLGFRVLVEMPLPGGNRFVMVSPFAGGSSLVFSLPMPGQSHSPVSSISFESDDVQETYEELITDGVTFPKPPSATPWGGLEAVFEDPFGNRFMLQRGGLE